MTGLPDRPFQFQPALGGNRQRTVDTLLFLLQGCGPVTRTPSESISSPCDEQTPLATVRDRHLTGSVAVSTVSCHRNDVWLVTPFGHSTTGPRQECPLDPRDSRNARHSPEAEVRARVSITPRLTCTGR